MPDKKTLILDCVSDTVNNFLYYNRKEDEDLPRGAIEEAVKDGTITVDEILDEFKKYIVGGLR